MNYNKALEYIHNISWLGSKPGLSRTRELLSLMGNPHDKLRFIHIAGTNGKGSVAAMLSYILSSAGYKTGLYTSPYIDRFNERIRINNIDIPDEELCELVTKIRPLADSLQDHPTEFELITCLAFQYFFEQKCDIVILETGLGGELDSTNVIGCPEAAVLTSINYDHTGILGNTIEEIALAKAGIIKENSSVVIYGDNEDANKIIFSQINEKKALAYMPDYDKINIRSYSIDGYDIRYDNLKIRLPLIGCYQTKNAALVLKVLEVLRDKGWAIPDSAITDGFSNTRWNARFEVLTKDPIFIVDGGHNPQGINAAIDTIKRLFPDEKMTFIFGVMADKDYELMLELLAPYVKTLLAVTPDNPRALEADLLSNSAKKHGIESSSFKTIKSAIDYAFNHASTPIIALGSLYMSGDIRKYVLDRYA